MSKKSVPQSINFATGDPESVTYAVILSRSLH
jgi:hypothetical protein